MLSSPPGKLEERASRTRLDTELGPRGNSEFELAFELLFEVPPDRFVLELLVTAPPPPLLPLFELCAAAFPAWCRL